MLEDFKKAKQDQKIILYKNFQPSNVTWQDVLNYCYDLSGLDNSSIRERALRSGGVPMGSLIFNSGYFLFDDNLLFDRIDGLKELMQKITDGKLDENCIAYSEINKGGCSCKADWHIQALRISLLKHLVSNHNDPNDVLYWQLLGTSYWKINNDKIYKLEPGDLFYFNQEDSHEVWQDGPRAGIIIDGKRDLD